MKAASRLRSPAFPLLAGLFLGLVLLCQSLLAQAQPDDVDPPARAARVGEVVGDAWVYDAENREWVRLLRNQTLGQGDRLRTDDRARVSLRIGSTSLWVDERSDIAFTQLDEGRMLLDLEHGDLGLRLRSGESATDTRVRTREGDMIPERPGLYRVEQLGDDSASRAYVWQGRLRFEPARGDGGIPPTLLDGGEQAEFWWAGGPRVERQRLAGDDFGDWIAAQRDADIVVAQRYVSPEMTGIEDLDRNGRWEQSPDYGTLWIPTVVAPDWAPYRDGRWVWSRNWGWTWVDDAPWGFAPFHYGRWVSWRGRWCWAPGTYVARPVYAPALVAWVGGGSFSVNVSVGGGRPPPPRFGWYPLAPREVYRPPYRHSPVYVERINGGDRWDGPRGHGRPPQSNLSVAGAVSFLPGHGGPVRALPPAEVRQLRPMPTPVAAPSRQEFARVLPQRPPAEVRAPAEMPAWRGRGDGGRGPDRPDRIADRDRDRGDPRQGGPRGREPDMPRAAVPNPQAQPQPQSPPQPVERGQRDWIHQADRLQRERAQQQQQQQQQQAQQEQQERARQEQQRAQQQQERQNQMERQNQERARAAEAQQRQQQQQERAQAEQQRAQQQQERQNQMERQNQERARAAEAQQRQQQQAQQPPRPQPQAQPQPRREDDNRGRRDDGDRRGRAPQQQER